MGHGSLGNEVPGWNWKPAGWLRAAYATAHVSAFADAH